MGFRRDRLRQLRNPRTRQHRHPYAHHEVDRIAHQGAMVYASTVSPGGLPSLSARVATSLECRRPTQCAEISGRARTVITDGVPSDDQGCAAKRDDDAHDSSHQDRCAAAFTAHEVPHFHDAHSAYPVFGSGTTCACASSGTATIHRPSGRAFTLTVTVIKLGLLSIVIPAPDGAPALALITAASSLRAACRATAAAASTQRS